MSIGQVTIGDAAKGLWGSFWRGGVWVCCMAMAAYLLGVEWNWRLVVMCVISSIADTLIYSGRGHVVPLGSTQGSGK